MRMPTPLEEPVERSKDEEYAYQEEQGKIPRNHLNQPMVWLPDGSKRVAYSRPSGLGDQLDDKQNLFPWHRGRALIGAMRQDKLLDPLREADAKGIDWDGADGKELSKQQGNVAFRVGGGEDRADAGTIWHNILEMIDHGEDPGFIPDEYDDFMDCYKDMMAEAKRRFELEIVSTELFGVFDAHRIAGTMDVLMLMTDPHTKKRRLIIGDKKTSQTLKHSMGKFSIQLWAYSHMVRYDPYEALHGINTTGLGVGRSRLYDDTDVWPSPTADHDEGFIFWIPSGQKRAAMVPIDISRGTEGYKLTQAVREWRNSWKRKANQPNPIIMHSREETEDE